MNLQGKRKLVRKIGEFEKSGVKLQCSTEEGKQLLVRAIGRFEKLRAPEKSGFHCSCNRNSLCILEGQKM